MGPKLPSPFTSDGGRCFTFDSYEAREGRRGREERWTISYLGEPAGTLCRDSLHTGLPWHATIRQLYWRFASDAPVGIGFDVSACRDPGSALDAWARSADQILDWSEGKQVRSVYSKRGFFQKGDAT